MLPRLLIRAAQEVLQHCADYGQADHSRGSLRDIARPLTQRPLRPLLPSPLPVPPATLLLRGWILAAAVSAPNAKMVRIHFPGQCETVGRVEQDRRTRGPHAGSPGAHPQLQIRPAHGHRSRSSTALSSRECDRYLCPQPGSRHSTPLGRHLSHSTSRRQLPRHQYALPCMRQHLHRTPFPIRRDRKTYDLTEKTCQPHERVNRQVTGPRDTFRRGRSAVGIFASAMDCRYDEQLLARAADPEACGNKIEPVE